MYRSLSRAILLFVLLMSAVMITPAYCVTITTYSSSASWLAATTGDQEDSLTSVVPTGGYEYFNSGYSFTNGVEFIGLSGSTLVADTTSVSFSWANFGTGEAGFVSGSSSATTTIAVTIPTPVTAFGINLWGSYMGNLSGLTYTVSTLSTPSTVPVASTAPPTFFGVTSDTPFTTVDLQVPAGTGYAVFDNFQWGTADVESPVPEAGTFLLIGTGLLGLAAFRRKTRQPR
jgi:PEP-CTERM motif